MIYYGITLTDGFNKLVCFGTQVEGISEYLVDLIKVHGQRFKMVELGEIKECFITPYRWWIRFDNTQYNIEKVVDLPKVVKDPHLEAMLNKREQ